MDRIKIYVYIKMEDLIWWPYALVISMFINIFIALFFKLELKNALIVGMPIFLLILLAIYGETYRKEIEKK